jgi:hypothetical protein
MESCVFFLFQFRQQGVPGNFQTGNGLAVNLQDKQPVSETGQKEWKG